MKYENICFLIWNKKIDKQSFSVVVLQLYLKCVVVASEVPSSDTALFHEVRSALSNEVPIMDSIVHHGPCLAGIVGSVLTQWCAD